MGRQAGDLCAGIAEIPRLISSAVPESLPAFAVLQVEPPPRATLFAPLPNGLGTPQVEHLTSYLHRLARLHQLHLSHLARELVRPVVWSVRCEFGRGRFAGAFRRRSVPFGSLFGAGPEALLWAWALELLTGRTDLRYLTLVSYGERASTWLRPARAWCAACYHDLRQLGRDGYDQLRWACASVVSCDIHDGPLWFGCPHCGARQPWQALEGGDGDLEYCSSCRHWLGGGAGATPPPVIPARESHAAAACPPAERPSILDDVLACAYRLRPRPPHDAPTASFVTFVQDVDAASGFYRHLLAQLRRRWALEHTSLWDTLGPSSGLKDAQAVERSLFGQPAFFVSPAAAWPAPVALRAAAALRHLAGQRDREAQLQLRKPPRPRRPRRPPSRPPARSQLELIWRLAAEQLRELEQLGQRLYPPLPTYQEWLPSRHGRDTGKVGPDVTAATTARRRPRPRRAQPEATAARPVI